MNAAKELSLPSLLHPINSPTERKQFARKKQAQHNKSVYYMHKGVGRKFSRGDPTEKKTEN